MGVSNLKELEETMRVWRSVLDGMEEGGKERAVKAGRKVDEHVWSVERKGVVRGLVEEIWGVLGEWKDYAWKSPDEEFLKAREVVGEKGAESSVEEVLVGISPQVAGVME